MSEQLLEQKGAAIPQFFVDVVPSPFRTEQEGRPCFDELESVRVFVPGDRNSAPVLRVNDEVKNRWPKQYQAFKDGMELPLEGTPLAEWPPISRSQVEEFAHFHIRTVEQLASVHDGNIAKMPMGTRSLVQQAKAFVDVAANGTAPIAKLVARIGALEASDGVKDRLLDEATNRIKELEALLARPAT